MKKIVVAMTSFVLLIVLLVAKNPVLNKQETMNSKKQILVTTSIIEDLVNIIAKDDFKVTALMGPGIDPHIYQATANDLLKLQNADLIIYNGLHLEAKLSEVLENFKQGNTFSLGQQLPKEKLIKVADSSFDPHIWFDTELWTIASFAVAHKLAELMPEKKSVFIDRASQYSQILHEKNKEMKAHLDAVDNQNKVLVTAHDAFGYFAKKYDWQVLALQGISTVSEASAYRVRLIVDEIVKNKIPAIFFETSVSSRKIQAIQEACFAKGWPVVIGGYLYTDALGEKGSGAATYTTMLDHNLKTITKAMRNHESLVSSRSQ